MSATSGNTRLRTYGPEHVVWPPLLAARRRDMDNGVRDIHGPIGPFSVKVERPMAAHTAAILREKLDRRCNEVRQAILDGDFAGVLTFIDPHIYLGDERSYS